MALWQVKTIAAQFGVKVATVRDRWVKRPDFPAPKVSINQKLRAWDQNDVIKRSQGEAVITVEVQRKPRSLAPMDNLSEGFGLSFRRERKDVRIYISGPMSGLPELNFPAFHAAAAALRAKGFDVVNPAEINAEHPGRWESCMKADIKALCDCDALVMLPGWERSNGAHLEVHLAHRLGMQILQVADM